MYLNYHKIMGYDYPASLNYKPYKKPGIFFKLVILLGFCLDLLLSFDVSFLK